MLMQWPATADAVAAVLLSGYGRIGQQRRSLCTTDSRRVMQSFDANAFAASVRVHALKDNRPTISLKRHSRFEIFNHLQGENHENCTSL